MSRVSRAPVNALDDPSHTRLDAARMIHPGTYLQQVERHGGLGVFTSTFIPRLPASHSSSTARSRGIACTRIKGGIKGALS